MTQSQFTRRLERLRGELNDLGAEVAEVYRQLAAVRRLLKGALGAASDKEQFDLTVEAEQIVLTLLDGKAARKWTAEEEIHNYLISD